MGKMLIGIACVMAAGCVGAPDDETEDIAASNLDVELRHVATELGLSPNPHATRYTDHTEAEWEVIYKRKELGKFLFFDHVLSGVNHTSCANCHHSSFEFGDGRNIARGVFCDLASDGGSIACNEPPLVGNVVGPDRKAPLNQRNTPTVINSAVFPALMWNGRFHFVDDHSTDVNDLDAALGFSFPAPENTLFTRSLLTAQAHIPVTEAIEMTGDFPTFGEPFPIPAVRNALIRDTLEDILSGIPEYRVLFEDAFAPGTQVTPQDPVINPGDPIPFLAIADAMAHFQEQDLVMTNAPWDAYLAGNNNAISTAAKRGALVFFGRGKCADCHSGDLFSDFQNHNIGVPQVGPGTFQKDLGDGSYLGKTTYDFGLEEITGDRGDRFKFRTPPLRGVALTSPYMHNGAYDRLEETIAHHALPLLSYIFYDMSQIEPDMRAAQGLKPMWTVFNHKNPVEIGVTGSIHPILLPGDIANLVAFLKALTDPRMLDTADLAPTSVPSGLPLDVAGPRRFPQYR